METCVSALKKYTGDDSRVKYHRHQSYPQGMNQFEQDEAEQGLHYSSSWSASDLKKGYSTLGPNHRFHPPAKVAEEKNLMSPQERNDLNIEPSSASGELDSSRPANSDSVDSMAAAVAALSMSKLPSVDEASEDSLTTRQERLDSLRKSVYECISWLCACIVYFVDSLIHCKGHC